MKLPPKSFNPNFERDIGSAGLAGLPFSWGASDSDLNLDDPRLTPEQKQAILGVALRDTPAAAAVPGSSRADVMRFLAMRDAGALPSSVGGVSGGDLTGPDTGGFDASPSGGHFGSSPTGNFSGTGGRVGGAIGAVLGGLAGAATGPAAPFTSPVLAMGGKSLGESAGRAIGGLFSSSSPVGPPSSPEPDPTFDPYSGMGGGPNTGPNIALGANDPGFSTSPFSTGTPFSANPAGVPATPTARGDLGPPPSAPPPNDAPPPSAPPPSDPTDPGPNESNDATGNAPSDSGEGDDARGGSIPSRTKYGRGRAGAWKHAKKFSGGGPVSERQARLQRIKAFEAKNGKVAI